MATREPQHVSRVGNELVVVHVYGARNLPALPNGSLPTAYVFVYVSRPYFSYHIPSDLSFSFIVYK